MYRIQVWTEGRWVWGINDYSLSEAENRKARLKQVGIRSRIKPISDLLEG
jgi:hypothetical protein